MHTTINFYFRVQISSPIAQETPNYLKLLLASWANKPISMWCVKVLINLNNSQTKV